MLFVPSYSFKIVGSRNKATHIIPAESPPPWFNALMRVVNQKQFMSTSAVLQSRKQLGRSEVGTVTQLDASMEFQSVEKAWYIKYVVAPRV